MAVDMFLKMKPEVKGESEDSTHKGSIDVLAWSWGASNSGTAHMGGGAGSGKVNVQDLSLTKYVDSASPNLLLACCNGKHFDEALLTVRKAGGEEPIEYIKIMMNKVLITSISTGGSGGEDRLTENVSLNFAKAKLVYTPQKEQGGPDNEIKTGWDIAANKQW
jgi:type VI secretion system secreted protein Hcp